MSLIGWANKHQPLIFAIGSTALTLTAVVLTFIGTKKATEEICEEKYVNGNELTNKEKAGVYAKNLWPAGLATTTACVNNFVGAVKSEKREKILAQTTNKLAATAALAMSELTNEQKKDIVSKDIEFIKSKSRELSSEEVLVYDSYNDRYIQTTELDLELAEAKFNKYLINETVASLNNFFDFLNVERTEEGQYIGWNTELLMEYYGYIYVNIDFDKIELADGLYVRYLTFSESPIGGYLY